MESKNIRTLEFDVTVCLGRGDGGDVCVNVDVTDGEFKVLKKCYRDDGDIYDYKKLANLVKKIEEAARDENEACMSDFASDNDEYDDDEYEEIDYSSVSYRIWMPDAVREAVKAEETDEEDE